MAAHKVGCLCSSDLVPKASVTSEEPFDHQSTLEALKKPILISEPESAAAATGHIASPVRIRAEQAKHRVKTPFFCVLAAESLPGAAVHI